MRGLFLDDERNPEDVTWIEYPDSVEWDVVRNYEQYKAAILDPASEYLVMSYDHDLADYEDGVEYTGYTCIKFFVELLIDSPQREIPLMFFHTKNVIGKDNMSNYFECYKRTRS